LTCHPKLHGLTKDFDLEHQDLLLLKYKFEQVLTTWNGAPLRVEVDRS
jgi:hypothetical protein